MRLLLFSDLHLRPSNLDFARALVRHMVGTAPADVRHAVFLGDWFHRRRSVGADVAAVSTELLGLLAGRFDRLDMLAGNHDVERGRHDAGLLEPFRLHPAVQVHTEPTMVNDVLLLPWTVAPSDPRLRKPPWDDWCRAARLVLAHHLPDDLADLTFPVARRIVLGHLHWPEDRGRLVVLGSCLRHGFADAHVVPGFAVLDADGSLHRHSWTGGPDWVELEGDVDDALAAVDEPTRTHLRLRLREGDPVDARRRLVEAGFLSVIVIRPSRGADEVNDGETTVADVDTVMRDVLAEMPETPGRVVARAAELWEEIVE